MPVLFRIPNYLASFAGGSTELDLSGTPVNVREALEALWGKYPALRDRIVDEQGELRQHINIFVGPESIRFAGGLDTPAPEGAEILIVPAVSGG